MRWFSDREILILPSPGEFILRGDFAEVRVAPVLWLDAAAERLHGLGDEHIEDARLVRVEIFRPAPGDPEVRRTRLLTMLLRHCLMAILDKSVFKLKPIVRFGSLAGFDSLLSGFQREIFERAALDAGARHVRFDGATV